MRKAVVPFVETIHRHRGPMTDVESCTTRRIVNKSISHTFTAQFWKLLGVDDGTLEPGSVVGNMHILVSNEEKRSVRRSGCVAAGRGFVNRGSLGVGREDLCDGRLRGLRRRSLATKLRVVNGD